MMRLAARTWGWRGPANGHVIHHDGVIDRGEALGGDPDVGVDAVDGHDHVLAEAEEEAGLEEDEKQGERDAADGAGVFQLFVEDRFEGDACQHGQWPVGSAPAGPAGGTGSRQVLNVVVGPSTRIPERSPQKSGEQQAAARDWSGRPRTGLFKPALKTELT
jgi:hypothetical protein